MSDHEEKEDLLVKQEDLPKGINLRDHVVDGIQEYDQALPLWWLIILFSAIGFAIVYWIVIDDRRFDGDVDPALEVKLAEIATKKLANSIDVTNDALFWEMVDNPAFVSAGEATFTSNCVACHGADLHGGVGFNLVDDEWVHGSKPSEIYHTVFNGVSGKGMQAWGPILGQKRITEVVSYVLSKNPKLRPE